VCDYIRGKGEREKVVYIERLCGSGWLIVKGVYKRMGSVALIY
jgi:hypothetical protein